MNTALADIVSQFAGKRVMVLGDVMLDEYIVGDVSRISPEAPVPVVTRQEVSYSPGGAGNAATNVVSLGGKVYLIGLVGDDAEGEQLRRALVKNGINVEGLIVDPMRHTTAKTRVIAHGQQIVRIDRETTDPAEGAAIQDLLSFCMDTLSSVDVVLVSDYAKGVVESALLKEIISQAKGHGLKTAMDPKGVDYSKYRGATVVTPNEQEAGQAVNRQITTEDDLAYAGRTLLQELECEAILVTRGQKGMSLFQNGGSIVHLPTTAQEVYDVTGAGDTAIAALSLALAVGAGWQDCARIGNYAAGIVVGKVGTATVSLPELLALLGQRQDDAYARRKHEAFGP